jgi:hypothetical protein
MPRATKPKEGRQAIYGEEVEFREGRARSRGRDGRARQELHRHLRRYRSPAKRWLNSACGRATTEGRAYEHGPSRRNAECPEDIDRQTALLPRPPGLSPVRRALVRTQVQAKPGEDERAPEVRQDGRPGAQLHHASRKVADPLHPL